MAIAATQSKSQIIYTPLPKDDPKLSQPDISTARQLLNWEPIIGLEEGMELTIAYFKNVVENLSEKPRI